jgi:hypothetical protein
MTGYQNDRKVIAKIGKLLLKIEPAHPSNRTSGTTHPGKSAGCASKSSCAEP